MHDTLESVALQSLDAGLVRAKSANQRLAQAQQRAASAVGASAAPLRCGRGRGAATVPVPTGVLILAQARACSMDPSILILPLLPLPPGRRTAGANWQQLTQGMIGQLSGPLLPSLLGNASALGGGLLGTMAGGAAPASRQLLQAGQAGARLAALAGRFQELRETRGGLRARLQQGLGVRPGGAAARRLLQLAAEAEQLGAPLPDAADLPLALWWAEDEGAADGPLWQDGVVVVLEVRPAGNP